MKIKAERLSQRWNVFQVTMTANYMSSVEAFQLASVNVCYQYLQMTEPTKHGEKN